MGVGLSAFIENLDFVYVNRINERIDYINSDVEELWEKDAKSN